MSKNDSLSKNDPTSFANIEDFKIVHSHLEWNVDFNSSTIFGTVLHKVNKQNETCKNMFLDANHLDIKEVFINNEKVKFEYNPKASLWGKLTIPINTLTKTFDLKIQYQTTKDCTALCWMDKDLTLGKRQPYVYSQCQAIHARSLLPCQDTPGNKAPYTAEVKVLSNVEVLMSAVKKESQEVKDQGVTMKIHKFTQEIPVPSYLIAIVVGDIVGKKIGPRSTVWCEKELVDDCAKEFEDTEKFLSTAEKLCGPYEWGVYDILVLPPTFPYGGMENPCLTFVTPCIVSGDKSQVFVIAHEIAHSWTGNLVTNSNWDHFWVNEGHTNYLERLILESLKNSEEYRHLHICTGQAELKDALDSFDRAYGKGHEFCKLVPHLVGFDPDDAFSRVPYEKGAMLLFYLENLVGKDKMMKWLKVYIKKHRLSSVNTDQWKEFFIKFMLEEGVSKATLDQVKWDEWFKGTGNVPIDPNTLLKDKLIKAVRKLADDWVKFNQSDASNIQEKDLKSQFDNLIVDQKLLFLRLLYNVSEIKLTHKNLETMDRLYGLSKVANCEMLFGWHMLVCLAQYDKGADNVFEFVNKYGRLMYNKPLYRTLMNWPNYKKKAAENFEKRKHLIHPTTRGEIKKILDASK